MDGLKSVETPSQISDLETRIGVAIAETLGTVQRIAEWPNNVAVDRIAELEASQYRSLDRRRTSRSRS